MTTTLQALWQRGIRLNQAPHSFAPKADKAEYKRLYEASAITAWSDAMAKMQETGRSGVDAVSEVLTEPQKILSARTEWDDRMRKFILHHLTHGNLFGYGFEPPRRMESQPYEIPAAYWAGRVRWDNATLTVNGLEFIEVRVLATQVRDRLVGISHETTTDLQRGRPSIKADVEEAFATLLQKGLIDISKSAKSHFPLVRQCLQTIQPGASYSDTKPGDEGIRTHFSPLFNELKKTNKQ
ncbi:hypothetical protein [Pseudophaeobacter flagellatus]|uniref:hypothetical protein n=1 Tax=Pseudophaeobacter flagellatus TaxID=2899119 RepID=UPI001E4D5D95|nr:hypothetical protein [Pseudophaeobacter flagellatus]MCD9149256.1 hypothetical protein [Pseudophaeobacter flagellatus]